jgi:hypothetical protein
VHINDVSVDGFEIDATTARFNLGFTWYPNEWAPPMKHAPRIALLTCLLTATAGCVTTNATRLGSGAALVAVPAESVAIYRTASQVPGRYQEVALLNSKGESSWTDEAAMFKSMRKKAGELGANGIILDAVSEPSAGAKVASAIFGTGAERKGRAIAILVLPAETGQK